MSDPLTITHFFVGRGIAFASLLPVKFLLIPKSHLRGHHLRKPPLDCPKQHLVALYLEFCSLFADNLVMAVLSGDLVLT